MSLVQSSITIHQEGSRQTIGGGSTCSNDDVINSMTSLLLPYSAQKVGGQLTPLTPLDLPGQKSVNLTIGRLSLKMTCFRVTVEDQ